MGRVSKVWSTKSQTSQTKSKKSMLILKIFGKKLTSTFRTFFVILELQNMKDWWSVFFQKIKYFSFVTYPLA